jgi:hypothetical protein
VEFVATTRPMSPTQLVKSEDFEGENDWPTVRPVIVTSTFVNAMELLGPTNAKFGITESRRMDGAAVEDAMATSNNKIGNFMPASPLWSVASLAARLFYHSSAPRAPF